MFTAATTVQNIAKVIVTLATLDDPENLKFDADEVRELYLKGELLEITSHNLYFFQGIRMDALYAITGRRFLNQESQEEWHRTFDAAVNYIYG